MRTATLFILSLCLASLSAQAQKKWHLAPAKMNKTYGASVTNAYPQLAGKTPQRVIVAVLDNGTDIRHKDLQPLVWTNEQEVPNNGKDDDGNGYIDDVHGWNFLGGADGKNMGYVSLQRTRNYQMLLHKYKDVDSNNVPDVDTAEYAKYKREEKSYNRSQKYRQQGYEGSLIERRLYDGHIGMKLLAWLGMGFKANSLIDETIAYSKAEWEYNAKDADSLRMAIVGDDPNNPHQRYYGNNDVIGPDPGHGTHTAGIIASVAQAGEQDWLRIMPMRVVPSDGDEYDKDVANAIRYAVDHGAKVISMSFGKYYSPFRTVVDSAIQYAAAHDVLLVHGAGNDNKKLDSSFSRNYPNPYIDSNTLMPNWIEVGANGKKVKKLKASFSNYGNQSVDVFAPGVHIYATMPNGKYAYQSGTSMAAPVVAGVAALLRSYYPEATAVEIKAAIMQSALQCQESFAQPYYKMVDGKFKRLKKMMKLEELCISGGVVNAAGAVDILSKK